MPSRTGWAPTSSSSRGTTGGSSAASMGRPATPTPSPPGCWTSLAAPETSRRSASVKRDAARNGRAPRIPSAEDALAARPHQPEQEQEDVHEIDVEVDRAEDRGLLDRPE